VSLETLLSLNGEIYPMEKGYWVKFEARRVEATAERPYGIAYSVTLHDRNNTRVLGYDNAHAVKPKRKGFQARKTTWDHLHKMEIVTAYEFTSAAQLIEDFWQEVNALTGYQPGL
jgi:hypothetical protein